MVCLKQQNESQLMLAVGSCEAAQLIWLIHSLKINKSNINIKFPPSLLMVIKISQYKKNLSTPTFRTDGPTCSLPCLSAKSQPEFMTQRSPNLTIIVSKKSQHLWNHMKFYFPFSIHFMGANQVQQFSLPSCKCCQTESLSLFSFVLLDQKDGEVSDIIKQSHEIPATCSFSPKTSLTVSKNLNLSDPRFELATLSYPLLCHYAIVTSNFLRLAHQFRKTAHCHLNPSQPQVT